MKKIISSEYGSDAVQTAYNFIMNQTLDNGAIKVFRPTVIIEIFDQEGNPV